MNAGYYVNKWIQATLKKKGVNGTVKELSGKIGAALAAKVVSYIVSGKVTLAVSALGGKIGALAGPIGVGVGILFGAL